MIHKSHAEAVGRIIDTTATYTQKEAALRQPYDGDTSFKCRYVICIYVSHIGCSRCTSLVAHSTVAFCKLDWPFKLPPWNHPCCGWPRVWIIHPNMAWAISSRMALPVSISMIQQKSFAPLMAKPLTILPVSALKGKCIRIYINIAFDNVNVGYQRNTLSVPESDLACRATTVRSQRK